MHIKFALKILLLKSKTVISRLNSLKFVLQEPDLILSFVKELLVLISLKLGRRPKILNGKLPTNGRTSQVFLNRKILVNLSIDLTEQLVIRIQILNEFGIILLMIVLNTVLLILHGWVL